MKHPTSVHDLLFDVDQVPIEAVVGSNGNTRRISIPGKKALVNKLTGLVLGVVSRDYRIVTNEEAVNLARDVSEKALPGLSSVEWEANRDVAKSVDALAHHVRVTLRAACRYLPSAICTTFRLSRLATLNFPGSNWTRAFRTGRHASMVVRFLGEVN